MTDTTTIIRLCRERAALYGAVRGSSLTAVALDRAADALEDALGVRRGGQGKNASGMSVRVIRGYNGAFAQAASALRYLANNDRPSGGEQFPNAACCFMIANDLERTQAGYVTTLVAAAASVRSIETLRRALAWHGDLQRMATTREEWQQEVDAAIAWVKANPEKDRPSFPGLVAADCGGIGHTGCGLCRACRHPPASQDAVVGRLMDLVEERLCIHWYPASNREEFAKLIAAAIAPQPGTDRRDSTS